MAPYHRIRPYLFLLDAERAHHLAVGAARMAQRVTPFLLRRMYDWENQRLRTRIFGLDLPNPIGLAAGFDKNGVVVPFWRLAGCGHVEIGSVSAFPSKGNPKPRAFRIPEDEGLINRMGLNNRGAVKIAKRLRRLSPSIRPLAINIVKTHDPAIAGEAAIRDFVTSYRHLAPLASWIVLNLSCPNTTEGKTFEDPNVLDDLLTALDEVRSQESLSVPVLLKLSPPVSSRIVLDSEVDEIVAVGQSHRIAGYIASNTASDREGLKTDPDRLEQIGRGGVSGVPLQDRSTHLVRYLYRRTEGRVPIIGVGGIDSGEAAYQKIRAGASMVQVYTGLVYHGAGLVRRIKQDLAHRLEQDGFAVVSDAVGVDA